MFPERKKTEEAILSHKKDNPVGNSPSLLMQKVYDSIVVAVRIIARRTLREFWENK